MIISKYAILTEVEPTTNIKIQVNNGHNQDCY